MFILLVCFMILSPLTTPATIIIHLFFFFNDTPPPEIYTILFVGSVRCV